MPFFFFFLTKGTIFLKSYSGRNKGLQSWKYNQSHVSRGVSCTERFSYFFTNCFAHKKDATVRYGLIVYVLFFLDLYILIIKTAAFLLELFSVPRQVTVLGRPAVSSYMTHLLFSSETS